tara:strand:- start:742 stop:867 length:126 start_codon:yes stop_codon:yes gene_type:complete
MFGASSTDEANLSSKHSAWFNIHGPVSKSALALQTLGLETV